MIGLAIAYGFVAGVIAMTAWDSVSNGWIDINRGEKALLMGAATIFGLIWPASLLFGVLGLAWDWFLERSQ